MPWYDCIAVSVFLVHCTTVQGSRVINSRNLMCDTHTCVLIASRFYIWKLLLLSAKVFELENLVFLYFGSSVYLAFAPLFVFCFFWLSLAIYQRNIGIVWAIEGVCLEYINIVDLYIGRLSKWFLLCYSLLMQGKELNYLLLICFYVGMKLIVIYYEVWLY